jgi:hypothetical protein
VGTKCGGAGLFGVALQGGHGIPETRHYLLVVTGTKVDFCVCVLLAGYSKGDLPLAGNDCEGDRGSMHIAIVLKGFEIPPRARDADTRGSVSATLRSGSERSKPTPPRLRDLVLEFDPVLKSILILPLRVRLPRELHAVPETPEISPGNSSSV